MANNAGSSKRAYASIYFRFCSLFIIIIIIIIIIIYEFLVRLLVMWSKLHMHSNH